MAGPVPPRDQAMAYWGTITRAATERQPASALGNMIKAEAERLGTTPGFEVYSAAQTLYSEAVALRHATEALARAPESDAITSAVLAPLPYGTNPSARGGPRLFDVRVAYTSVRGDQESPGYVTLRYTGELPATVGELRAEAADIAGSLVEGYGESITALGDITIGEL